MGLLVAVFLASIFFSFLCSILEAVLLSITPAYVALQEQAKTRTATDLARFKQDIDRPLAAILSLNTIAHTVGAVTVGSQATVIFGETSLSLFGQSLISLEALIAGGMTMCILIFSEIIPKTIGANNWESLTPFTVRAIRIMLVLLAPFVWMSQFITRHLKKDKDRPVLSRSDFALMTQLGKESGALKEVEHKIIDNLLRFNRIHAKDVMTPRIVVVTANEEMSIRDFHQQHVGLPFSRIPIYHGNKDNITGYILKDELLLNLVEEKGDRPLGEIRRDVIVVPLTVPIPSLLDMFIAKKEHMALVVDEFGGMEGIVSMEDIIETLLGLEIVDESDSVVDMQALARKNWEARAQRMGILPLEATTSIKTDEGDGAEEL